MKTILGGKGANLAEMTNLGIPVPPGFTISAELCNAYLADKTYPPELKAEVEASLKRARGDHGPAVRRGRQARCWCRCAPAPPSRCPG